MVVVVVVAAAWCSLADILSLKSVYLLSLPASRIWLTCSVVMVLGVLLAAAASALHCWVGTQALQFSADAVLSFSSQSSGSYASESSNLAGMFDIVLLGMVWEGMICVKGNVVKVTRLTVRCCMVMVVSTGVLLEWSVDNTNCSEEGNGDSSHILLRGSAITFLLPSMCSMVLSS